MPPAVDGLAHHARHSARLGVGLGDVEGVVRGAVGDDLGVDRGAAGPSRLQLLEHQNPGSLADHKTVASRVEGTRGARRILLLGGQPAHVAETREDQRR